MMDHFTDPSLASLILRWVLGWFFILARFRWIYSPDLSARRASLEAKVKVCGYPKWMAGPTAYGELFGGLAVVVGFLTPLALALLFSILVFATKCTAVQKVMEQKPVDAVDCVSCYLWRVEGVYIAISLALLFLGPGAYSLDFLFFGG